MKQPIELRRLRDFGQIINDTFSFFKENFKPLFMALIVICGFFIILGTIASVFTFINRNNIFFGDANSYEIQSRSSNYLLSLFLYFFVVVLAQLCINLVTFCYISVYIQKNNATPTLAEVWGYFKYYFFRVLGSGLLIVILLSLACLLCLVPGIYLAPIFLLIIPIIVIENSSFRYAFNKSFQLIKNNWWVVFGVIFIMWVIVFVSSLFVSVAIQFVQTGTKLLFIKSFTLPLLIFFSFIKSILMLIYVIPAIAISLCYFSLSEEKEGTGLLERIGRLGKNNSDNSALPTEEY